MAQLPPISLLVKHLYWACICTTFAGPGRSSPNNDGCVPKPSRPQPSESRRGEQRFFVSIRFTTDFTQQRRPTATAAAAAPAPLLHFAFTLMTLASPAIEWGGLAAERKILLWDTAQRKKEKKKNTRWWIWILSGYPCGEDRLIVVDMQLNMFCPPGLMRLLFCARAS